MDRIQPAWLRVSAWTPIMAIAAGLAWAAVRPLQEEHPAPFTYEPMEPPDDAGLRPEPGELAGIGHSGAISLHAHGFALSLLLLTSAIAVVLATAGALSRWRVWLAIRQTARGASR